jgi:hypothetical protein
MLAAEFARFAGVPVRRGQNQADITNAVCDVVARLRVDLVLVDEIHNLNLATRSGADASDQLKYLAERIPATFTYAGVNAEGGGLFAGTRGQQIAGRFGVITCQAFPYGTAAQRQQRQALIATLEQSLRLHRHQPGQLLRLDAYLHDRTDGMIGSLSHLIRGAAWKPSLTAPRTSPAAPWTTSAWTTPPKPPAPAARPPPGDAMPAPAEPLRRLPVPGPADRPRDDRLVPDPPGVRQQPPRPRTCPPSRRSPPISGPSPRPPLA